MIFLNRNVQMYCFECHSITKIKYGHPWPNKVIKRSQNTVHKVTLWFQCPWASESLVGAWANSCRVRGRLSLLMMTRPKSSKACSRGSISSFSSKWVMVPAPAHITSRIFYHCSSHMGKRSSLEAECCFHKFFLGVPRQRFSKMSSYMKALTFPSGATNGVFPPLWVPIPYLPLSRHHIVPVSEYSNVGGSHHLIA